MNEGFNLSEWAIQRRSLILFLAVQFLNERYGLLDRLKARKEVETDAAAR